jgi:hypothetical protein
VLLVFGVIGLVAGLVPLAVSLLRIMGVTFGVPPEHWAAHGPAAMGMGTDWATLSSADGAFLGGLLIAAGIGWRRGRPWAPLVTLIYGIDGLLITGVDLMLFIFFATPGRIRTMMLVLDTLACALAAAALVGLLLWRRAHRDERRCS